MDGVKEFGILKDFTTLQDREPSKRNERLCEMTQMASVTWNAPWDVYCDATSLIG